MALCDSHAAEWLRWVDHYQDAGPVTRFRHYSPSEETRRRMSEEMRQVRIQDRRELIRQQQRLIENDCATNCTHQEGGTWPTSAPTPSSTSDTSTTPR